ncbi:Stp1/IreP family PP2C-type Ser/Thr phosphatase [Ktedonobacter racemifer]|uniref:Protein serine/threonine phosphatase n=1 Tax=Ktedonobacter racemifer DSM 44963 TaxID=485913 RepID=D6TL74_KTERA|nr:Stp1/IreP family PP2C-type Ser/Thr phosphatase [Ktedonobacter racemifer]EFH86524.1 protein serine/threonine phosphatase [Ktedonobacter racemifer DSM 44963]
MSKQLRLDVAQLTDVGRRRPHNEDNMAYVIPKDAQMMAKKGALFIVADGMGGHAAGEVASEIAVDTISKVYYQDDRDDVAESLVYAIKRANTSIHQRAAESVMRSGMGTTCVAAVLRGSTAYVANVGDSRAYLVHKGQVRQVSQDHSWVEEQVRAGLLTQDQARSHAQRNVITRSLGTNAEVEIDIFAEPLDENDSLLLCSDGLSGMVDDEELRSIVDQYVPRESVYHLVERANENGGTDNITAIVIRVQELGWEPPNARRPMRMTSREVSEEPTKIMGSLVGAPVGLLAPNADASYGNTPLRVASGPLTSTEGIASPQTAVPLPSPRSKRLLFPTLALFVLLIVALVGGGAFWFLGLGQLGVNVNESLTSADQHITSARAKLTANPANALQDLQTAQQQLRKVQTVSLTSDQRAKLDSLNSDLETSTKSAITNYNQRYLISNLLCANTTTVPIASGDAKVQPSGLAVVQHNNKKFYYTEGYDYRSLYLMDDNQHKLGDKLKGVDGQITSITGADGHLLVLTLNSGTSYSLQVFTPDDSGALTTSDAKITIPEDQIKKGYKPLLVSAWDKDAYVLLTSTNADNTALILDYALDKVVGATDANAAPPEMQLSSANILNMAAFPGKQLFLLLDNGTVQSVQFNGGKGAAVNVGVQQPIYAPLNASAQAFTSKMAVPAPAPQIQATLLISRATSSVLSAMKVGGTPHLFVADGASHRLLDLNLVSSSSQTAPKGQTTGTPPIKVQLSRQYVSANLLGNVKGIAADPGENILYLVSQTGPVDAPRTQLTIDASKASTDCQP